jgi:hypothetical protein
VNSRLVDPLLDAVVPERGWKRVRELLWRRHGTRVHSPSRGKFTRFDDEPPANDVALDVCQQTCAQPETGTLKWVVVTSRMTVADEFPESFAMVIDLRKRRVDPA